MSFILSEVGSHPGASAESGYSRARRSARRTALAGLVLAGAGVALLASAPGRRGEAAGAVMVAVGLVALSRSARSDPQQWLRGASGERSTAALLDALGPRRWVVRHDLVVPGSRANIDHLVIGPTGVWVVDTKTTRAVVRTGFRRVYFGDRRLDTGPLRWEAEVVSRRLGVAVRPIVAVHSEGWRERGGRADGVRVVPAARLVRRIRRGRRRLTTSQVRALAESSAGSFASFEKRGPTRVPSRS